MKFCFTTKSFIEVESNPNKIAIIGEDEVLTWADFKRRSDEFCEFFKENELHLSYSPVLVYGSKSVNMIVAFYSLIRMEIPYIPADIIYPKERIQKIISIANSSVIINTHIAPLNFENTTEINFIKNNFSFSSSAFKSSTALNKNIDPLVYIIFTSGSTGEPKGVQISTEAILSFTNWMRNDFGFSPNDVFVNTAILSFDLSVFEVMTFGVLGASILLNAKEHTQNATVFMKRIEQYKGSVWVSTPSFAMAYSRIKESKELQSVHTFLFCGEVLPHLTAKNLKQNFPGAKVLNTYGPTEATVATTLVEITDDVLQKYHSLPVGYPKPESTITIEDGEIVISGKNVSLGYLNNPELNEKKFGFKNNLRFFKTGDLGYIENGMLFFNGRNDDLIKLNGYRIELNEINTSINSLNYVIHAETIALKRDDIAKKIVALLKVNENEFKNIETLRTDLTKILPHYMIPSDFKIVNEIPLNQNGKADKKLLEKIYLNSQ